MKIARGESEDFTIIASGEGAVDGALGGVLARFDPTMLPNDNYRVQIIGSDGQQTGGLEFRYGVAGEYKVGNFVMYFTDLSIPVAGIPLTVVRSYDSLDVGKLVLQHSEHHEQPCSSSCAHVQPNFLNVPHVQLVLLHGLQV